MNKIILFIILFFSVLRIGYGEEHVEVSITADKCSLVEGDELLITYCITNKSLINYSFSKLSNQRLNSLYFFNKDALLKRVFRWNLRT